MRIVWDQLTPAAWQDHAGDRALMQQHWRYGAAVALLERGVHRAAIWQDRQLVGLAQLLMRSGKMGRLALIPGGPVWGARIDHAGKRAAFGALRRSLPGRGPALMLAATAGPGPAPGVFPLMTAGTLADIDLTGGAEAMRAGMSQKWRNSLRRAERAGPAICRTHPVPAALRDLIARDLDQQRARGYRALPPAFLEAWHRAGPEGGLRLYSVRTRGRTLAAMLFLHHPPGATYHIGWTGEAGRALSAHHLLLWSAMQDFAKDGLTRLGLGTLDTVTAPGLARFKLGSGAKPRRLGVSGLVVPWSWPGRRRFRSTGSGGRAVQDDWPDPVGRDAL